VRRLRSEPLRAVPLHRTIRRPSSQEWSSYGDAIDKDRATLLRELGEVKG